ncbi:MAG: hypothetical protein M1484_02265 [Patescibacteria group bacterium]|nr:hypothetical protein [Patescibacteria group bacterium]
MDDSHNKDLRVEVKKGYSVPTIHEKPSNDQQSKVTRRVLLQETPVNQKKDDRKRRNN